ncbi:TspO/MBR family protein [Sphingomonas bacterium]|uniref:TspO/MBR family protein n=1 Tax=Sphingomonas bacterium TaxID=1895847 RepID=UPI0015752CB7|nr:TspO/MBR family protein [Sphingomonas bacterium]
MGQIASKTQLRMSFLRWAMVVVPLLLLLGFVSGRSVPVGAQNHWYGALEKPAITPPDWVFPVAWSILYVLIGLALATVLNARGARGRGVAMVLFVLQFILNLVWQPTFFGGHLVYIALIVIAGMLVLGIATTMAFARVRTGAAWLMVPYLVWISFAGVLTWRIGQLNPDAATLVPAQHTTQML